MFRGFLFVIVNLFYFNERQRGAVRPNEHAPRPAVELRHVPQRGRVRKGRLLSVLLLLIVVCTATIYDLHHDWISPNIIVAT